MKKTLLDLYRKKNTLIDVQGAQTNNRKIKHLVG